MNGASGLFPPPAPFLSFNRFVITFQAIISPHTDAFRLEGRGEEHRIAADREPSMKPLPRGIIILGLVSFFTDLSSEMIYPLLPVFLSSVLGAGALALGVIEGIAESTASLFKVVSGIWTDRTQRRKPFIFVGYGVSGLVRPLIAFAPGWIFVLLMRFADRIGKGTRSSPRDALVADITDPGQRGAAYGLHRSLDHAGAVFGPLVAAALLGYFALSLRQVFFLSIIPAILVMYILAFHVKEPARKAASQVRPSMAGSHWKDLGGGFKLFLAAILLFTLGNSTDAFLILRMSNAGVSASHIAILWSAHHIIKMIFTYGGGHLSDRFGPRRLIVAGWIVYALIYAAFSIANTPIALIVIFLLYGIYFGLTEPSEKSLVVSLVPVNLRGTAFGYYHFIVGLGALPASLLFGLLWHTFSAEVAFLTGAGLALLAALLLIVSQMLVREAPEPEPEAPVVEAPQSGKTG